MTRLMSVSLTEDAVRDRSKTVTRRLNWWENKHGWRLLHVGDELTLVRKVMGRKAGELIVPIAQVEVVSLRREPLNRITYPDVAREGFPGRNAEWFVDFFAKSMKCAPDTIVTRVEWRYIEEGETK